MTHYQKTQCNAGKQGFFGGTNKAISLPLFLVCESLKKILFVILMSFWMLPHSHAWEKFYRHDFNNHDNEYRGYTMLRNLDDDGYIIAGTSNTVQQYHPACYTANGTNNIHVAMFDDAGNLQWSYEYEVTVYCNNFHVGKINYNTSNDGYVICGWSEANNYYEAYIIEIDATSKNITRATTLTPAMGYGAALNIIPTSNDDYIVVGTRSNPMLVAVDNREAFVAQIEPNGATFTTNWVTLVKGASLPSGTIKRYDAAESVVAYRDGNNVEQYFVVGTMTWEDDISNPPSIFHRPVLLSFSIASNGAINWNASSGHFDILSPPNPGAFYNETGAAAAVDQTNGYLYAIGNSNLYNVLYQYDLSGNFNKSFEFEGDVNTNEDMAVHLPFVTNARVNESNGELEIFGYGRKDVVYYQTPNGTSRYPYIPFKITFDPTSTSSNASMILFNNISDTYEDFYDHFLGTICTDCNPGAGTNKYMSYPVFSPDMGFAFNRAGDNEFSRYAMVGFTRDATSSPTYPKYLLHIISSDDPGENCNFFNSEALFATSYTPTFFNIDAWALPGPFGYDAGVPARMTPDDHVHECYEFGFPTSEPMPLKTDFPLQEHSAFFNLYPQPAGDYLNINLSLAFSSELCIFEITDAGGKVVVPATAMLQNTETVNTSEWPQGIYFIRMQSGTRLEVARFVKL